MVFETDTSWSDREFSRPSRGYEFCTIVEGSRHHSFRPMPLESRGPSAFETAIRNEDRRGLDIHKYRPHVASQSYKSMAQSTCVLRHHANVFLMQILDLIVALILFLTLAAILARTPQWCRLAASLRSVLPLAVLYHRSRYSFAIAATISPKDAQGLECDFNSRTGSSNLSCSSVKKICSPET